MSGVGDFVVVVCLFDISEIKNLVIEKPILQFFVFQPFIFFLLPFGQCKLRHKEKQKENKTLKKTPKKPKPSTQPEVKVF